MPKVQSRFSVDKRWSPDLVRNGWTPVSDAFLRRYHKLNMTSAEAMLVVHLHSFKWSEEHPFPSAGKLSSRMGISDVAVRNIIRSLEKKGMLTRIYRGGKANMYDLSPLYQKLSLTDEELSALFRPGQVESGGHGD